MHAPTCDSDFDDWDYVVVNTSAGKDSQAMMECLSRMTHTDIPDKFVAVHCDLGRVEWPGCPELAREHAEHYGMGFRVVSRPQGDLLDHVKARGMWPSPKNRYCTSDHKRGQVDKVFTSLTSFAGGSKRNPVKILNCMGHRKQESANRAKLPPFELNKRASNSKRQVYTWLPIHDWSKDQVWETIRASGVRHHPAYDLGMPRLSCCFCIYAPKAALLVAAKQRPELLQQYVDVEREIGHKFRVELSMADLQAEAATCQTTGPVTDWSM